MISFFFPSKKSKAEEQPPEDQTVEGEVENEKEPVSETITAEYNSLNDSSNQPAKELANQDSESLPPEEDSTNVVPIVVQENLDDTDENESVTEAAIAPDQPSEADLKALIEAEKLKEKKSKSSEAEGVQAFETVEFYSKPIRKLYHNKHWQYFLEDIIALTGTIDLHPFIDRLKRNPEFQKHESKYIQSVTVLINGKEESVECITAKGCLWLIPILRPFERFFPGPFPTWIETISAVH